MLQIRRIVKNKVINLAFFALVVFALWGQLLYWNRNWLGCILIILYFFIVGFWWRNILSKVFFLKRRSWITCLFAIFSVFLLLSFVSGIFAVWYKLPSALIWIVFLVVGFLSWFLFVKAAKLKTSGLRYKSLVSQVVVFPKSYLLIGAYLILVFVSFYFLFQSQSVGILSSPWQGIHPYYLPLFFFTSIILGVILFSKHKTKTILLLIIVHSILLHAYLPLSHKMPYGGDVWRMIGVEQKLVDGEFHPPVIAGPAAKSRDFFGVSVPEALVIPNKYVYGQLWGSSVLISKTAQIDLVVVNKWLIPILWAIFLPLIFFRIGYLLFRSYRKGLLLAALSLVPFTFQILGSLTLGVSLGYLTFFFVLMFWLQYIRDKKKWQRNLVFLFSSLMIFGYTLHFILIWFVIALTFLLKRIYKMDFRPASPAGRLQTSDFSFSSILRKSSITTLAFISIFIFPVIELVTKISYVPEKINLFQNIKQAIGQFSGWYYASQIRPHDILTGNILFNHTPEVAFFSSLFTDWRWYIIPLMLVIWLSVLFGLWGISKSKRKTEWSLMGMLFAAIIGGYLLGWFVLEGDRSFIRRFDGMFAFLVLIFFLQGFSRIIYHIPHIKYFKKIPAAILVFILIFTFSWFGINTYASGPDMRVVSQDEFDTARYIWDTSVSEDGNYCVLGDTWMLLALEGVSAGKIVGGGFPIDYQFGQPERVVLFGELLKDPRDSILKVSHGKTNSKVCFLIIPKNLLSYSNLEKIKDFIGQEAKEIGGLYVWREELKVVEE